LKQDNFMHIEGINFNFLGTADIVNDLDRMISEGIGDNIYYINVHVFNLLRKHKDIIPVFNSGYVINDGIGIYMMLKILSGNTDFDKCVTTDVWNGLLQKCSEKNLNISVYGGETNREGILNEFLASKYPGIKLVKYTDGYHEFSPHVNLKIDILFIGTGSFKQELFAHSIRNYENIKLKICVGSAIDYWTGAKKRAPLWMQQAGLEWLHRLLREPRRLWKRYILGIPVFMFYVLVQKVKLMLKK
jgi:N-acetylglucosaminyldiphosphoundecaprenol N-acetyl-beta-D-mannosaminyltransferase